MKKILITGATDGIGFEAAKLFAAQGHYLLIHGRSEGKLESVKAALQEAFSNVQLELYRADLSRFNDVKSMLESIKQKHDSIDVIINNAGILKTPEPITNDGLDIRFVVNTLAPYIITRALLPLLADKGRVINLSSAAQAPINLSALKGEVQINEAFQAYAQSKLAITIWSQELAKDLKPEQVMLALNPGSLLASKMVKEGFGVAGNDLSVGADILLRTALSEEFSHASGQCFSGKYYDNDAKRFADPHSDALDPNTCKQLLNKIDDIVQTYYVQKCDV